MIQPLRRLHYWVIIGAAVVLPIILLTALYSRRPLPKSEFDLPTQENWPQKLSLQRNTFKELIAPDPLIYWSPVKPANHTLPSEALLVGAFHEGFFHPESLPPNGYFVLYSLAHREVVATLPVDKKENQP